MNLLIVPITLREANDFVQNFHRHNGRTSRDGGKFAVGLECDESMVGVAIVGNPLSATFMDGFTAEVLRVCTLESALKAHARSSTRPVGVFGEKWAAES